MWWKKSIDDESIKEEKTEGGIKYSIKGFGKKYKSSLGWGSGKLSDLTSSFWIRRGLGGEKVINEQEEILKEAFRNAKDLITILDFPFDIDYQMDTVDLERKSSTSRRLFLPTKVFENNTYSEQEKTSIFCGSGIHEAAHLKYTSLDAFGKGIRELTAGVSPKNLQFLTSLMSLIEDERIEDCLLKERPGYSEFIDKVKLHSYNEYIKNVSRAGKFSEAGKFLDNLFRLIRFPNYIEKDVLEKYSDIYEEIQNILSDFPESTFESCKKAREIYDCIVINFKEDENEDNKSEDNKSGGDSKEENDGESEMNFDDFLKSLEDKKKPSSSSSSKDKKSSSSKKEKDLSSEMERFSKLTKANFDSPIYGKDKDSDSVPYDKISEKIRSNPIIPKLVKGSAERGTNDKTFFEKVTGDIHRYRESYRRIEKYIPGIRKLIKGHDKNYDFSIHGCRSGLLDTGKLAEAYQGVPQVYIRMGKVTTNKTTVCVLIDESGSMCGSKEVHARDAAVLLNEAVGGLPGVDLYIYGHSADDTFSGATELYVYREGNSYMPKYSLSESHARHENRDGTAIYEVAKRVRKFTDSDCIMFVISDGEPCARGYYGDSAIMDTKKKVMAIEKEGFQVIQVTIEGADEFTAKRMFKNVIDLKGSLEDFPKKLSQVIKKAIVKDKKVTIS